jgi:hypothetical protein
MALSLGVRRSTLAGVASALAAMALAAAVAGRSCRVTTPGPEVTVRELLSPRTRAQLAGEAKRATDLVGTTVRYTDKDMISIGASDNVAAPTDITVIDEHGGRAVVEVVSPNGRARVDLVQLDGRWYVDLPAYGGP